MKTEERGLVGVALAKGLPVPPGFFQQGKGADDVGLHEGGRAVNGAVHMAFGGKMHDAGRLEDFKGRAHGGGVRNIRLDEVVAGMVLYIGQRGEVAGIGQLVDVDDAPVGGGEQKMHDCGADEARAAGDNDGMFHACFLGAESIFSLKRWAFKLSGLSFCGKKRGFSVLFWPDGAVPPPRVLPFSKLKRSEGGPEGGEVRKKRYSTTS